MFNPLYLLVLMPTWLVGMSVLYWLRARRDEEEKALVAQTVSNRRRIR
jgi:hypothetical protein